MVKYWLRVKLAFVAHLFAKTTKPLPAMIEIKARSNKGKARRMKGRTRRRAGNGRCEYKKMAHKIMIRTNVIYRTSTKAGPAPARVRPVRQNKGKARRITSRTARRAGNGRCEYKKIANNDSNKPSTRAGPAPARVRPVRQTQSAM